MTERVVEEDSARKRGEADEEACHFTELPDWKDMPEPRAVMTLSWEDVWFKMCEVLERRPTKEEVLNVFYDAAEGMDDTLVEDYWLHVEYLAQECIQRDCK